VNGLTLSRASALLPGLCVGVLTLHPLPIRLQHRFGDVFLEAQWRCSAWLAVGTAFAAASAVAHGVVGARAVPSLSH